ncbi:MAG: bifunctional lysine ketoglutarate reductase /saccharopine dehydrogenase family protein [Planctomycetota bacterium]|jgi:alpha-aminoadipic semialdehyde synthase
MQKILGIRREDVNKWERRTPLTPDAAKKLRDDHGISIYIQPSDIRIFPDEAFTRAGCVVSEDLSGCPVVIGIKEVPADILLPEKTYMFFSHTIKGQSHNMGMLKRLMDSKCNLIDYEMITNAKGKRLVFFGIHAGLAGMIGGLWSLGQRFEAEGIQTPLQQIRQAKEYRSLDHAKQVIAEVGEKIARDGLGPEVSPLTIGFCGYGNVSLGAQEIFDLLPHIQIEPEELASLADTPGADNHVLYKVIFKEEHMAAAVNPGADFDLIDYYNHPGKYRGVFSRYLPYLTYLVNCIFWTPKYPRLITKEDIRKLYSSGQPKLRGIADISCDIEGSVEVLVKCTDSGNPTYVYVPDKDTILDGFSGKGPVILAVENLPAEIALEASTHFSNALIDYIDKLVCCDFSKEYKHLALPEPLKKALILHRGKFTPDYMYMQSFV